MADKQDSHYPGGTATAPGAPREDAAPPLPMHHRVKLGHFDAAATNPFGTGMPSKDLKIANNDRKTY
jgi:hypothetical protein